MSGASAVVASCLAAMLTSEPPDAPTIEFATVLWLEKQDALAGLEGLVGLSGIARAEDGRWLVVSDKSATVGSFRLVEAAGSLSVRDVRAEELARAGDFEAIRVLDDARVLIADEASCSLVEFDLDSGEELRRTPVPRCHGNTRTNRGLESLAIGADGSRWTATERALTFDEPAGGGPGFVRLLSLDEFGQPGAAYAYEIEPPHGAGGIVPGSMSGLVELVSLADGRLLGLERSMAAGANPFRSRLYLVECSRATNIAGLASLDGADFRPVEKALLWEGSLGNLEGLALGPARADGSRLLVGVIDDGDPFSAGGLVIFRMRSASR